MNADARFYDEVIAPIRGRMMGTIWRMVRDPGATDDVVQDVLLYLYKHIEKVRRHPNPTALILRICNHRAIDHLRRNQRRQELMRDLDPEEVARSSEPGPDESLQRREYRERVLTAVNRLPRRQAEALMLHVVEDLPYPDVARALGCRESTARVLVYKARKRLRHQFFPPRKPRLTEVPSP